MPYDIYIIIIIYNVPRQILPKSQRKPPSPEDQWDGPQLRRFAASQLRCLCDSRCFVAVLPSPTKSYPILALVLVVRLPVMALSWPWTKDDKNLCIATRTFKGKVCSHLQRWTMVNHHCLVTFMFWMTFVDDFVNLLQQCSMKSCEGQHGNTQNHRTKWLWRQLGIWNTL
jgi:hypothetical protein